MFGIRLSFTQREFLLDAIYSFPRFLIYTIIGCIPVAIIIAGSYLGHGIPTTVIVTVLVAGVIGYFGYTYWTFLCPKPVQEPPQQPEEDLGAIELEVMECGDVEAGVEGGAGVVDEGRLASSGGSVEEGDLASLCY
jgi:hypothetical protein